MNVPPSPPPDRVLTLLREEFDRTLELAGVNDVATLARRHVQHRPGGHGTT